MTSAAKIAEALGMRRSGSIWCGPCPSCGYTGGFTVVDRDGRTLARCHVGCEQASVLGALRRAGLWGSHGGTAPPIPVPRQTPEHAREAMDHTGLARNIWQQAQPIAGTLAERYLLGRGITGDLPATLRFAPALRHSPTGLMLPALIAAVTRWPSRGVVAIHRTYLTADGRTKAGVSTPKMTLGPTRCGAVRLAPASRALAIGEGVESALSFQVATGIPSWSALSCGNVMNVAVPPPDITPEILLLVDADEPGERAAVAAAERFRRLGHAVKLVRPGIPGTDMNDLLQMESEHVA